jgi:hypothetical protein
MQPITFSHFYISPNKKLTLKFQSIQDVQLLTAFYVDDVSLRVFDGNYLNLPLLER